MCFEREVVGPCVGSILVDVYDFPIAITVIGLLNLAVAVLLLLFQTSSRARTLPAARPIEIRGEMSESICVADEREPLMSETREITYGAALY